MYHFNVHVFFFLKTYYLLFILYLFYPMEMDLGKKNKF